MKLRRLLLLVTLLAQLGGCAYVSTLAGDFDQRIDHWVAEREYGKALNAIDWVRPDDPRYRELQAKRAMIEKLARAYEKDIIGKAQALAGQGDWSGALSLYDQALAHLPNSRALRKGRDRLSVIQLSRSRELEHDLVVQRGKWLARAIPVQERLAQVNPRDRETRRRLEDLRREAHEIADKLYADGTDAINADDIPRAQSSLSLAAQLEDAPKIGAALKRVRNRRARSVRHAQKAREKAANEKHQQQVDATVAQYRDALAHGEYVRAQALMMQLEGLAGSDPTIDGMRANLDRTVHARVERYLQDGATAYSLGNFEQALGLWDKALELEPNNTRAKERAERARRVLRNVRELRQKQAED